MTTDEATQKVKELIGKYVKAVAIDPNKEYVIVVGRNTGLSPADLASIPVDHKKVTMLLVKDINQIRAEEYQEFLAFAKHQNKV